MWDSVFVICSIERPATSTYNSYMMLFIGHYFEEKTLVIRKSLLAYPHDLIPVEQIMRIAVMAF